MHVGVRVQALKYAEEKMKSEGVFQLLFCSVVTSMK